MEDLPTYLFPLPGERDATQIDSTVLAEVCQKLSVSAAEVGVSLPLSLPLPPSLPPSLPQVLAAVRGDDPHDQLAIAYQLVWDNRVLQKVFIPLIGI